jgi:TatD DNase family protein
MIDTHCHLTFPELATRLDDVIGAAAAAGVDRMITIGTTPDDALRAAAVAEKYPGVYFAVGIHPGYSDQVPAADRPRVMEIANHPRCVALGEMGVDYHYPDPPRALQHETFAAQLQLIADAGSLKPIIVHCRKAVEDTLAIIRDSGLNPQRFVFHCVTEPPAETRKIIDFGAMLSFTGIATYKNAPEVQQSFLLVPSDRFMIETDAPFLSPEPHRKVRPNEPKFVAATARFLAQLRGLPFEEFVAITDANALRFFGV